MEDAQDLQQEPPAPELAILSNSAALNSLKRPQLVGLCKELNLSAKGKNVELIERLEGKGKQLETTQEESWSLVGSDLVPTEQSLEEFGIVQRAVQGSMSQSSSGSQASLKSTLRSAGNKLRNTFNGTNHSTSSTTTMMMGRPTIQSIYPSLTSELAQLDNDGEKTLEFEHSVEGGIRCVTTRTSYAPSTTQDDILPLPLPMTSTPAPPTSSSSKNPFVFGSPIPSNSPLEFSIMMPGSLRDLSTTTCTDFEERKEQEGKGGKTAQELVVEEMNRRARESRKEGIKFGGVGSGSEIGGKKRDEGGMFDGKHKRVFDAMDSITNHYAAKRPHPSSSSNLAQLASSPKKVLATSTSTSNLDRPVKRIKPSNNNSAELVSALKEEGWTSTSLSSDLKKSDSGSKMGSSVAVGSSKGTMSLEEKVRERQVEREREREERKRRLELAKARRKSGATPVKGRGRGRLGITAPEAKPPIPSTSSTASQFLKSTFRKLTHTTSTSTSATPQPLPSSSSTSQIPRFASSTASSSTRAGLVHSQSIRSIAPLRGSPIKKDEMKKKEPGWKKFDLQESLKRGMSWKSSISSAKAPSLAPSNSVSTKPSSLARSDSSSLSRQFPPSSSTRAFNPSHPLQPTTSRLPLPTSQSIQSIQSKLDALPPAPKTPFTPLTNSSHIGKKGGERKVVSSVSKKQRGLKGVEGLESRARKIRAVRKGVAGNGEGK